MHENGQYPTDYTENMEYTKNTVLFKAVCLVAISFMRKKPGQ